MNRAGRCRCAHDLPIFEAFDEPWKGNPDNPTGAEKDWGVFFVDRTPKLVVQP
ncbi:MAG: hypothetical protein KJO76_05260 [Gammaproteobacteria bacterium]|nr:hypothetical protein [Gammaproteobacteria bacterium]